MVDHECVYIAWCGWFSLSLIGDRWACNDEVKVRLIGRSRVTVCSPSNYLSTFPLFIGLTQGYTTQAQ